MSRVIMYVATSLDGFIATNGSVDWLPNVSNSNDDCGYKLFYDKIGTTLMGRKTYEQILTFDVPFPYPDTINYVFTRQRGKESTKYVKFINQGIIEFVKQLKKEATKDIWIIGGSEINTLLFKAQLIDKIILSIIPVAIGQGISLFNEPIVLNQHLKYESTTTYPSEGIVQVTYSKI